MNVIESGTGWINAYVVAENLDPAFYLISVIRALVEEGNLPSFAQSTTEKEFFARNNVSMLSNATFGVGATGYNNASHLIGLYRAVDVDYC